MLIAPETLRWMRRTLLQRGPAPWSTDAAGVCELAEREQLRTDTHGRAAERACVDLRDSWQATDAEGSLSREQLDDLLRVTTGDDYRTVLAATTPIVHCWQPNPREIEAARRCATAWNARAARLRSAGIDPWPATATGRLQRKPRRVWKISDLASSSGALVMHARMGALTHRMVSIILEEEGSLLEIQSEAMLLQELTARSVNDAVEITADVATLVWRTLPADAEGIR